MNNKNITFNFSAAKNTKLIKERGVSFEDVIVALGEGYGLDVLEHPNKKKYPNQKIFVIALDDYVYLVPFIEEDEQTLFLKTIFPSRKMTQRYLRGGSDHDEKT